MPGGHLQKQIPGGSQFFLVILEVTADGQDAEKKLNWQQAGRGGGAVPTWGSDLYVGLFTPRALGEGWVCRVSSTVGVRGFPSLCDHGKRTTGETSRCPPSLVRCGPWYQTQMFPESQHRGARRRPRLCACVGGGRRLCDLCPQAKAPSRWQICSCPCFKLQVKNKKKNVSMPPTFK